MDAHDLIAQRPARPQRDHRRMLVAGEGRAVLADSAPACIDGRSPENLVPRQAEYHLGRRIGIDHFAVPALQDKAFRHGRKYALQLLLGRRQSKLELLSLGDVGMDDDYATTLHHQRRNGQDEPALLGRGMARVFQAEDRQAAFQYRQNAVACFEGAFCRGAVAGLADVQIVAPDLGVCRRLAWLDTVFQREAPPDVIDRHDDAITIKHGDLRGNGVQNGVKALIGFAPRLFKMVLCQIFRILAAQGIAVGSKSAEQQEQQRQVGSTNRFQP